MTTSLNGDWCRYCQPQFYIDRLEDILDAVRDDIKKLIPMVRVEDEEEADFMHDIEDTYGDL